MNNEYTNQDISKSIAIAQAEIDSKYDTIKARSETLAIVVNILNSFLEVKQNSENPFPDNFIAALQSAIDRENAVTNEIMYELEMLINKLKEGTPSNIKMQSVTENTNMQVTETESSDDD